MKYLILQTIRAYQAVISPILIFLSSQLGMIFGVGRPGCRFYPTCSEYTGQAVEKFGVTRGLGLGLIRILKCNPLFNGGTNQI